MLASRLKPLHARLTYTRAWVVPLQQRQQPQQQWRRARHDNRSRDPDIGLTTPAPDDAATNASKSPFYFEAGYAGWAKRPSRPFPPPFAGESSDRGPKFNEQLIRGVTVGDDAMLVSANLIGANDGVGAWAQREKGHAPLWSRLILHFQALAAEKDKYGGEEGDPDPVRYLGEAYERTKEALSAPNEWHGTTTASSALLHYTEGGEDGARPVVYVTQLGDSKVMIVRPRDKSILFETEEQWHHFDCPRQLGTNSPDTPAEIATMTKVDVDEDDIVLALSDGVTDNLWAHEISDAVIESLNGWREKEEGGKAGSDVGEGEGLAEGMRYVASELVLAARKIAEDPFAESPFMERAVEEGLAIEGGKMDDISVVAALCRRRKR